MGKEHGIVLVLWKVFLEYKMFYQKVRDSTFEAKAIAVAALCFVALICLVLIGVYSRKLFCTRQQKASIHQEKTTLLEDVKMEEVPMTPVLKRNDAFLSHQERSKMGVRGDGYPFIR